MPPVVVLVVAVLKRFRLAALLLALALGSSPGPAAAQTWQALLASSQPVNSYTNVSATAVDGSGNIYLAGSIFGTASFGSISLISAGSTDGFVAKWSAAAGQFEWARRLGGTGADEVKDLVISGPAVYLTGSFSSPVLSLDAIQLTNVGRLGTADVFVAKLIEGTGGQPFAWAQRAGGSSDDYAYALAQSGTSLYVAGSFLSFTTGFGPTTLANASMPPNLPYEDAFVAKLTDHGSSGDFVWAQQAGGLSIDIPYDLTVHGNAVYATGVYHSPMASFGTTALANAGHSDVFVACLLDAGTSSSFAWARGLGSTGFDIAVSVAVEGSSVYVGGCFNSPSLVVGSTTLVNVRGEYDGFVAKLTDAGSSTGFVWARHADGERDDFVTALAVRGTEVYVAGSFRSATLAVGGMVLTNAGPFNTGDVFITKLLDAGSTCTTAWVARSSGSHNEGVVALALAGTTVYLGGSFNGPGQFGPHVFPTSAPSSAAYVALLRDNTALGTAAPAKAAGPVLAPNPAHARSILRCPAGTRPTTAEYTLLDALGRPIPGRVLVLPATGNTVAEVDVSGLPAGRYSVRMVAAGYTIVRPLLVE